MWIEIWQYIGNNDKGQLESWFHHNASLMSFNLPVKSPFKLLKTLKDFDYFFYWKYKLIIKNNIF